MGSSTKRECNKLAKPIYIYIQLVNEEQLFMNI